MGRKKLVRMTTVPMSLDKLITGQPKFMQQNGFDVVLASAQGPELGKVEQETGIKVNVLPLTRIISPIQDMVALWRTFWFFRKHKPDIVHTHTPKAGIIGMLAARFAMVPNRLHTVAGLPLMETTGSKRKILSFVEKITYSSATKVYPNSKGLKEIILNEGFCSAEKLKVLGQGSSNGIDTSYFAPDLFSENDKLELREKLLIEKDDFVFVFVGRMVSDKGVNELVKAFTRVLKKTQKVKLLMVGPFEDELDGLKKETYEKLKNFPEIIFMDYQADVRPYLSISNVLAFPSYREGFPNVVMQAGAMGLPSIVSNINGCNEIILEKKNGMIIPPKDEDSLYHAMNILLENSELYKKLRLNSRKMITERFEQSVVWNALLQEYEKMV